ncbi:hypothetical protein ABT297_17150 [Dactylosporangium sp. NPDC000555]|uniref:hypothetical protein n=1 Tax=Dactylosporangium sp. NPDC000555 TaxID=3154260 RepID=UPI00332AF565
MSPDTASRSVVERLRAMEPGARAVAVRTLAERGLLATIDVPPVRLVERSDALTRKQSVLWQLDHDGRHGDFYHCGALWFAPSCSARALDAAYRSVAGGFDALGRVVDGGGRPRSRPAPVPEPVPVAVPASVPDPMEWVRRDAAAVASRPLDPGRSAAMVRVYALPDGSGALAVVGHDVHLDHQGLVEVLGPAVAARLTGSAPVVEEIGITDVAAWQLQRLDDGVLGVAVDERRAALAGAPRCPWPTGGDRAGRRVDLLRGARAAESLRGAAAEAGVSPATLTFVAWYRALSAWDPRLPAVPIGCCTTARLRPELRSTLGNLTNTVVLRPAPQWSGLARPALVEEAHQAMKEALGSVDLPFELVFGDGATPDEAIGVRFTFVEGAPSGGEPAMRAEPVRFSYAKSVLSCEVHLDEAEGLRVWLDYRPAQIPDRDADRLAALLRAQLMSR